MKKVIFAFSILFTVLLTPPALSSMMEEVEVRDFPATRPTLGPVLGAPDTFTRRFWARGPVLNAPADDDTHYHVVVTWRKDDHDWSTTLTSEMFVAYNEEGVKNKHDYTGFVDVPLDPGKYLYRCGVVESGDLKETDTITWPANTPEYSIHVKDNTVKDTSIVLGSCRYFVKFLCFYFWLNSSDASYASMAHQINDGRGIDAFVTLGDFIYADSLRWVNQARNYRQFMNLYEAAYSTPGFKQLVATTPMFTMLDDHEVWNNFNEEPNYKNIDIYRAGTAAYGTYQRMVTPGFNREINDPSGGYTFMMAGVPALMLDTRAQRSEGHIVTAEAMHGLKNWLTRHHDDPYKMIFTGVPVFPAYTEEDSENHDKWYGYQNQLKDMLGYIDENQIHGVIFGSGDIHKSCYSQIRSANNGVIITNVVSSPFYWPYGHDFLHEYTLQIEDDTILEFIPGYAYVTRSAVYPTDGFARVTFLEENLFDVQLYGKDNEYLNEKDPAGHVLNTMEFKVNL